MDFVHELQWRGMIHTMTSDVQKILSQGTICSGYIGFDPTAPSLQVGNLATIMLLVHFQRSGHKPIVVSGGATGMIGDPSGRDQERQLLSMEKIQYNLECQRKQLTSFLDFDPARKNCAEIVNNYDWFRSMHYLEFLRDVGKYLTISYMMAKDSVQLRLESGISYAEFSYQLLQAYDFYWLFTNKNCKFQFGGSDQWGNITSGIELIRRKASLEAHALTCPLITRADGSKFGKSSAGENLWLDPAQTSAYKFYQYWFNCADQDAAKFLRIFTLLSQEEIQSIETQHSQSPHLRLMQKELGKHLTSLVHGEQAWSDAVESSEILFGNGSVEHLRKISERDIIDIFQGLPQYTVALSHFDPSIAVIALLAEKTQVFSSKAEARRLVQSGGVMINKVKITDDTIQVSKEQLLHNKYLIVQKGKKNFFLIIAA